MKRKFQSGGSDSSSSWDDSPESGVRNRSRYSEGEIPKGLPNRFYNKEGEVDLRQVTGDDALKFFSAQGIRLPVFPRNDGR